MKYLFPAMVNSPETQLASDISEADTTIPIVDTNRVPDGPNLIVIVGGSESETVKYLYKSGNNLMGCIRGFQGTAKSWPGGTTVARLFTAYDYDAVASNLLGDYTIEKSGKDIYGIFKTIKISSPDGSYMISQLSGPGPNYTTRTESYYDSSNNLLYQKTYSLTYDIDNDLVKEQLM